MNDEKVINKMVEFIEDKERQLQTLKLSSDNQAKIDIVKAILDELESETKHED